MFFAVLVLLFWPLASSAHTTFTTLFVDGVNQGDGTCIRMNRDPQKATFPIEPVSSKDIACGTNGEQPVSRICPIHAGSTLTFEFREWPDASGPGSIDKSHKGPCAIYMKRVQDASASDNAAGDGWFKIWQLDYDASANQWCTEKLIANHGFLSVVVPADLSGGDYLVRTELLGLHEADKNPPDPQFFIGCAQVVLSAGGNASPETVTIGEGTYHTDMPGLVYNIYEEPLSLPYPMFGPSVYQSGSSARPQVKMRGRADDHNASSQERGAKPAGCILERDNWCGFEVPDYSTEQGCWKSSENCWSQSDVCWNSALPTGSSNCQIWQDKCTALDERCKAGDWTGPPNKGKVLTPKKKSIDGSMAVFTSGTTTTAQRKFGRRH